MRITNWFGDLPDNVKGGIVLMFAAFGFAVMTLLIKIAGERLHVTQILFVRQVVMAAVVAPAILNNFPGALRTSRLDLQLLRIALAFCAMLLGFSAVIHMPLADATALGFAKSFFVTIFAIIFLDEVIGIRRWSAVVVGFIGVIIILQPGLDGFSIYGVFALTAAACVGIVMVIIRKLSKIDSPVTILSYQAIGVGIVIAIPGIWYWQSPSPEEWIILLAIGGVSFVAQMLNIYAYKFGEASVMASLDYVRLIYAVMFGYLIFGNLPTAAVWAGAAVIIAASLYTIQREARNKQVILRSPEGRGKIP